MNTTNLQKFNTWWNSRKHTRTKLKGLHLSDTTNYCYLNILKRLPDINITEDTDIDDTIFFIRTWLADNCGEGDDMKFKTVYPQLIFTIRTYLKMFESDPNPKINRIASEIRKEIKAPIYQDIKGTQRMFKSKFLSKEQIRDIITRCSQCNNLPHSVSPIKAQIMFQILYDTGCRIRELSTIHKKDIEFVPRTINIIGKGKYERKTDFEQSTCLLLEDYCKYMNDEDLLLGLNVVTLKQYFREIMRHIYKGTKDKSWKTLSKKVSPHWFRHSRATHLGIVWKGDMLRLKDKLGWSDIKMAECYITNLTLLPSKIQNYTSTDLWRD